MLIRCDTTEERNRPYIHMLVSEVELHALLIKEVPESLRQQARELSEEYFREQMERRAAEGEATYRKHTRRKKQPA